jgi:hypothetical protein
MFPIMGLIINLRSNQCTVFEDNSTKLKTINIHKVHTVP